MRGCPGNRNVEKTFVAHASRRCFASGLVLRKIPMDGNSDTQQTASRVHLAIILMKFQVHLSKAFAKLDLRNGSEVTIDFFLLEERKSCIFGGGNGGGGGLD